MKLQLHHVLAGAISIDKDLPTLNSAGNKHLAQI